VSCSYGTFLEHPISARVGKWLCPNRALPQRGRTSTPAAMVISHLDTPHARLVVMNFPAASPGSGFEK
jgi:hypothetical protein